MKETIINIFKMGMDKNWAFPKLFFTLKHAGLKKYVVEVDKLKTTYFWKDGIWAKDSEGEFWIKGKFNANAIKKAIDHHNKEKTSFIDFIKDIARNGCTYYVVDFENNQVVYYGKDNNEKHIEKVPLIK